MKIDPATGKLLSVHSGSEFIESRPVKVLKSVPAPDHWWQRSDLVPLEPQGEPSISGPAPDKWMCDIKFGNSQTLQAAPGAFIIPDAKRAFIVSTRRDPSVRSEKINETTSINYGPEGRYVCTINPVIIMPTEQKIASGGGGKWNSIGNIGKTPSPNVEPATAVVGATELGYAAGAAIAGMLGLKYTIEASGKTVDLLHMKGEDVALLIGEGQAKTQAWLEDHPAVLAGTTLVIQKGADLLVTFGEMAGLSAVEMGQVVASANGLPSKGDVEAAIKRNDPALATPLSSTLTGRGICNQNEYDELSQRKADACPRVFPGCGNAAGITPLMRTQIAFEHMKCALRREELDNKCYDGGDSGHRLQRQERWNAVKNCLWP